MQETVLDAIYKSQLLDNNVRAQAESDFLSLAASDPSGIATTLMGISLNKGLEIAIQQAALLYLNRIVNYHWSLGFSAFVGNPIAPEAKAQIRTSALQLVCERSDSRIRKAAANLIVTIAMVDYPDEWPDLFPTLYSFVDVSNGNVTSVSVIGGLNVLQELFDDLITDEQFFEGGVGASTLNYCLGLLSAPTVPQLGASQQCSVSLAIKNQAAKLFEIVLKQLHGQEVYSNPNRLKLASEYLPNALQLVLNLVKEQYNYSQEIISTGINILNIENVLYATKLYEILTYLVDSFNKKLFSKKLKFEIQLGLVSHLANLTKFYYNIAIASAAERNSEKFIVHPNKEAVDADPQESLDNLVTQIVQLLGSLSDNPISQNQNLLEVLLSNLLLLNTIPYESYEGYIDNFNLFVTDETEMSGQFSVRNSISDYLSEVQTADSAAFLTLSLNLLSKEFASSNWRNKESILNILEAIFLNEDDLTVLPNNISFENALQSIITFSEDKRNNPAVIARSLLVLAKFLEKFGSGSVPNLNDLSYKTLLNNLRIASSITIDDIVQSEGIIGDPDFDKEHNDAMKIVQSAALISLTYFNNFLEFQNTNLNHQIQQAIHQLMLTLVDEAEEDTPAVLLEALTISMGIDLKNSQSTTDDISLIFQISSVDFSNILNVQTAKDSLETLLSNISDDDYLKQCEFGIPSLLEVLKECVATDSAGVEYTPKLNMALELLNIFIENCPSQHDLPESLFNFIFDPLSSLLVKAVDDQILQIGGEVFNTVLINSNEKHFISYKSTVTNENGIEIVLKILEKFLSPTLSDSAAMNVGSIVVSIVQKFRDYLGQYIPQILESATRRLIIARHAIIIENLMPVYCYLVLLSPTETLNFLASLSFQVEERSPTSDTPIKVNKSGIDVVLPIWLDSFTTTRGYERIKENVLALGKLFLLNDSRVKSLVVNGDIIPNEMNPDIIVTRSMAKKMPTKYAKISASLKILKLFIQELGFQQQQPDPNEYIVKADEADGDGDGWEDLDDIGVPSFNKLKDLVDDDAPKSTLSDKSSQELKDVLVNFLKQCIIENSTQFRELFEQLNDHEKKILAETIGF